MDICIIVPCYNNGESLKSVIDSIFSYTLTVIVINDGSTDNTQEVLSSFNSLTIISYKKNRGKGYALRQGFSKAVYMGYRYAITLDADGQHSAADLPLFEQAIKQCPDSMITGCRNLKQDNMPSKNTFANKFSNFWFFLQTGRRLADTQSGFRLYPLHKMYCLMPVTKRYEAELEMLIRAAWKNIPQIQISVSVHYSTEHITHFRPTKDFLRISLLNAVMCVLAVVYGYPSRLFYFIIRKR